MGIDSRSFRSFSQFWTLNRIISVLSKLLDSIVRYRVYYMAMGTQENLKIGVVAKRSNVNVQTIRYYERRGILKPEKTLESGYRLYTEDSVKTIKFIKHAQELGFKLEEIKGLLNLRTPSVSRCQTVRKKAKLRLEGVQTKIAMLKQIEKTLKQLINNCQKNKTSNECPIIESMED